MNTFRTWFTPGSLALAMLVALLWLHQLHWAIMAREFAQFLVLCLTFLGFWVLTREPPSRR